MTSFEEEFSKEYIESFIERVYSLVDQINTKGVLHANAPLVVDTIKIAEALNSSYLLQLGEDYLYRQKLGLQYHFSLQLIKFYSSMKTDAEKKNRWLKLSLDILQSYIHYRHISEIHSVISSVSLLTTVIPLNDPSIFEQVLNLTLEDISYSPFIDRPYNFLALAKILLQINNYTIIKFITDADTIFNSNTFKELIYTNQLTFETKIQLFIKENKFQELFHYMQLLLLMNSEHYPSDKIHFLTTAYTHLIGTEYELKSENLLKTALEQLFSGFKNSISFSDSDHTAYYRFIANIIQDTPKKFLLPYQDLLRPILDVTNAKKTLLLFRPFTRQILLYKLDLLTYEDLLTAIYEENVRSAEKIHPAEIHFLITFSMENNPEIWKNTSSHKLLVKFALQMYECYKKSDEQGIYQNLAWISSLRLDLKAFCDFISPVDIPYWSEVVPVLYRYILAYAVKDKLKNVSDINFWIDYGQARYYFDYNDFIAAYAVLTSSIQPLKLLVLKIPSPKAYLAFEFTDEHYLFWSIYAQYVSLLIELDGKLKKETYAEHISVFEEFFPSYSINFCPLLAKNGFIQSAYFFLDKYYHNPIYSDGLVRTDEMRVTSGLNHYFRRFYSEKAHLLRLLGEKSAAVLEMQKTLQYVTDQTSLDFNTHNGILSELLYLGMNTEIEYLISRIFEQIHDQPTEISVPGSILFKTHSPLFQLQCPEGMPEETWQTGRNLLIKGYTALLLDFFENPALLPYDSALYILLDFLINLKQNAIVKGFLDKILVSLENYIRTKNLPEIESQIIFMTTNKEITIPAEDFERIMLNNPVLLPATMSPWQSLPQIHAKMSTMISSHISRIYHNLAKLYNDSGENTIADTCKKNGLKFEPISFDITRPLKQPEFLEKLELDFKEQNYLNAKAAIEEFIHHFESTTIQYKEQLLPIVRIVELLAEELNVKKP